jgi:hypothetical protein
VIKTLTTSGTTESFIHLLMMAEAGIPVLGGFYLEANAGLLALSFTAFVAHQGDDAVGCCLRSKKTIGDAD